MFTQSASSSCILLERKDKEGEIENTCRKENEKSERHKKQESKENAGFIDQIDCVNSHLIVSVLENTF